MKTMKAISATKQAHATAGLFAARQASMSTYSSTKVLLLLLLVFVSALALATAQVATAQTIKSYIDHKWEDERYTVHDNYTVTDNQTTLMWKQCTEGRSGDSCADDGDTKDFNWIEALEHANSHLFAGYSDWRVPNIKELQSLVAFDRYDPAINITVFPNTESAGFWSASPFASRSNYAWVVHFRDSDDGKYGRNYTRRLRMVRGGQ